MENDFGMSEIVCKNHAYEVNIYASVKVLHALCLLPLPPPILLHAIGQSCIALDTELKSEQQEMFCSNHTNSDTMAKKAGYKTV